ncbi:MAG: zinc metalloprotease HtpX [Acidobacteriota bacterium]|nr:zinc metalloprotease HtpX [Acidobacteriota bacterium]
MNQFKTLFLIVCLTGLLVWIGDTLYPGGQGLLMALAIAVVMNFVSYFYSDKIVLASYGARTLEQQDAPDLYLLVSRIAKAGNLPLPRLALIEDDTPNAFATGRDPEHAVVAVTTGMIRLLSDAELEGVLAHELGHVAHRDILLSSITSVLVQAIMFLSRMAMWVTPHDEEGRPHPFVGLVIAIFAPISAMVLQLALSRSREYLADEYSAQVTGRPLELANALERISGINEAQPMRDAQPATAHMMIVNPLRGGGLMSLFSTHPPIAARIERLRAMATGR